jgi:hypothetical protein
MSQHDVLPVSGDNTAIIAHLLLFGLTEVRQTISFGLAFE